MMLTAMNDPSPTKIIDRFGAALELVLYKYDACPFCMRVIWTIDRLGLPIELRDIRKDPAADADLRKIGGKRQVPMMTIVPLSWLMYTPIRPRLRFWRRGRAIPAGYSLCAMWRDGSR